MWQCTEHWALLVGLVHTKPLPVKLPLTPISGDGIRGHVNILGEHHSFGLYKVVAHCHLSLVNRVATMQKIQHEMTAVVLLLSCREKSFWERFWKSREFEMEKGYDSLASKHRKA